MYEVMGAVLLALAIAGIFMLAVWAGSATSEFKNKQYGSAFFIAALAGLALLVVLWSFDTGVEMFKEGERIRKEEREKPVPPPLREKEYRFRCMVNGKDTVTSAWYVQQGTVSNGSMVAPNNNEVYEFRQGELCRWEWRYRPST